MKAPIMYKRNTAYFPSAANRPARKPLTHKAYVPLTAQVRTWVIPILQGHQREPNKTALMVVPVIDAERWGEERKKRGNIAARPEEPKVRNRPREDTVSPSGLCMRRVSCSKKQATLPPAPTSALGHISLTVAQSHTATRWSIAQGQPLARRPLQPPPSTYLAQRISTDSPRAHTAVGWASSSPSLRP